jgi:protein required for attachment to host cells
LTAVNANSGGPELFFTEGKASESLTVMRTDASRTWALAINSTRCRILRGLSSGHEELPAELVLRAEAHKLRDIMADKPGRSFASVGGGRRSSIEYSGDPIAEDRKDFVRQVISLLESHRRAGDFTRLAVFAEHDMLGYLRQLMPRMLADLVVREEPKNLLHLSPHELAEAVWHAIQDGSGLS